MKENSTHKICLAILAVAGLISFFFLMGEETAEDPMTMGEFALVKGISIVVFAIVAFAAQAVYNKVYGREEK